MAFEDRKRHQWVAEIDRINQKLNERLEPSS